MELVDSAPDVLCFGECMLELSRVVQDGQSWAMGVAGDSYNVAVNMKRLGSDVGYMTALGEEDFSEEMLAAWDGEGLSSDWCLRHADRLPGLYAIRLDDDGERRFSYWRSNSAARAFFECSGVEQLLQRAAQCKLLYLSGITLSLFDNAARQRIAGLAIAVRQHGGKVAFDTNYRPKGWPDKGTAQSAIEAFAPYVDIALPTFEDEQSLFGDHNPEATATRWHAMGVGEVVVKRGQQGALVSRPDSQVGVAAVKVASIRDTTGAGDSFNAAYLAARLQGENPIKAAEAGCRLAALVVQHPGAIIDKSSHLASGL